jgi:hypothetical protein
VKQRDSERERERERERGRGNERKMMCAYAWTTGPSSSPPDRTAIGSREKIRRGSKAPKDTNDDIRALREFESKIKTCRGLAWRD